MRLPWIPESDRRRAVSRVKLGCFSCLSNPQGEVEHFQRHTILILFSTPATPVWKELAVSLPAKGRFFFLFLHHSYPEQEAYRTEDHQRLQEPEQRSAVLKIKKKEKNHCFKVKLGKPAVYRIFPGTERRWNNMGEFTASVESWRWWQRSISSRLMDATKETTLIDLWPQLKRQLFSTHGHI